MPSSARWPLLAVLAATAAAQSWRAVDRPLPNATIAYDELRQRVQVLDPRGELWELGDKQWWLRPSAAALPTDGVYALAHDPLRQRTLALRAPGGTQPLATWEWDGHAWSRRATAHAPAVSTVACTFDSARGVVLLLGNSTARGGMDTWTFDGVDWTQQTLQGPPIPGNMQLTFDRTRGRAVAQLAVFSGGSQFQTWEWDGVAWSRPVIGGGPLLRDFYAFAYDQAAQRVLLGGGSGSKGVLRDLWEYDGVRWTLRTPSAAPMTFAAATFAQQRGRVVARTASGELVEWDGAAWAPVLGRELLPTSTMTLDPVRGRLLRFGGSIQLGPSLTFFGDTWEHAGHGWERITPPHAPTPRAGHALWNDGNAVWLWGGVLPSTRQSNETWRFDGVDWTQIATVHLPAGREGAVAAYDPARRRAVLFGGENQVGVLADTWEFDGVDWLAQTPSASPPARSRAAIAYDAPRGRVVMCHGLGLNGAPLADGYQWDGVQWTALGTVPPPSPFGRAALAFDAVAGHVTLCTAEIGQLGVFDFDGAVWTRAPGPAGYAPFGVIQAATEARGTLLLDTGVAWRRAAAMAHVDELGGACAGAADLAATVAPSFDADQLALELTALAPRGLALVLLGASAANVPFGSCTLQVGAPVAQFVLADGRGVAALPLRVPDQPALRGRAVYAQAANVAPTVSGFALSAALRLALGD